MFSSVASSVLIGGFSVDKLLFILIPSLEINGTSRGLLLKYSNEPRVHDQAIFSNLRRKPHFLN